MYLMRFKETRTGISVMDKEGNEVGVSRNAGKKAVNLTALTRVILPTPGIVCVVSVMSSVTVASVHNRWFEGDALYA